MLAASVVVVEGRVLVCAELSIESHPTVALVFVLLLAVEARESVAVVPTPMRPTLTMLAARRVGCPRTSHEEGVRTGGLPTGLVVTVVLATVGAEQVAEEKEVVRAVGPEAGVVSDGLEEERHRIPFR